MDHIYLHIIKILVIVLMTNYPTIMMKSKFKFILKIAKNKKLHTRKEKNETKS